jgi:hypothetical protein
MLGFENPQNKREKIVLFTMFYVQITPMKVCFQALAEDCKHLLLPLRKTSCCAKKEQSLMPIAKLWLAFICASITVNSANASCAKCSPNFVCEVKGTACPETGICTLHADDCGNWAHLMPKFPDAKIQPIGVPTLQGTPSATCTEGIKGPSLAPTGAQKLLEIANGNWLLARAMMRLEAISKENVFDSGAYSFSVAETPLTQQLALLAIDLGIPNQPGVGYNGFVEYRTTPAEELTSPTLSKLRVELHIWRVSRSKLLPTHGMKAWLFYEKEADTGTFIFKSIRTRFVMPTAEAGVFEESALHTAIIDDYLASSTK